MFLMFSYGWFSVQLVVEGNWMICTFDSWSTFGAVGNVNPRSKNSKEQQVS